MIQHETFQDAARQPAPGLASEFCAFLMENKKWWLAPILIILALLAVLMLVSSTPMAPFVYTLF